MGIFIKMPLLSRHTVRFRLWPWMTLLIWSSLFSMNFYAAAPQTCLSEQLPTPSTVENFSLLRSADGIHIPFFLQTGSLIGPHDINVLPPMGLFLWNIEIGSRTQIVSSISAGFGIPAMSRNENLIAFASIENYLGENADGNFEIFVFDIRTNTLTQVTHTTDHLESNFPVSLNADERLLALTSNADFTGGNADHNNEIFLLDLKTHTYSQITNTASLNANGHISFNLAPLLNADGTRLILGSNANFVGENLDGNSEIFLFDVTTQQYSQITRTTDTNFIPSSISDDAAQIVFKNAFNQLGQNADGNSEIFLFDTTTNTLTQITQTIGAWHSSPYLSADGTTVTFGRTTSRLTPAQILQFDIREATLAQVTPPRPGISNSLLALSRDGSEVTYSSSPWPDLCGYDCRDMAQRKIDLFRATCLSAGTQSSDIYASFESPQNGPVSGISGIHGWIFSGQPEVQIGAIHLLIDGVRYGEIPCCSGRADVQAAFPDIAPETTFNSAWGMPLNWGLFAAGPHTVQVEVRGTDDQLLFFEERQVTVIKPPGTEFLDQFDLSTASASVENDTLILSNVLIRDQASRDIQNIRARFQWFTDSQSLRMVGAQAIKSAATSYGPERYSLDAAFPADAQAISVPQLFIDHPAPAQTVAGIAILNGWTLSPDANDASQHIVDIRLMLDGQLSGSIPCCFERADVAAAFPENPDALNSGWGLTFNYGLLPSGQHTIGVRVTDSSGSLRALQHAVHVVRPGEFEIIDQFDLSQAAVHIEKQDVVLEGILVRDKTTQQQARLTLHFRWSVGSQTLGLISSEEL